MATFTNDEENILQSATMGALSLVSASDPGFFATFKESAAGSRALTEAPPELRKLIVGWSTPPMGSSLDEVKGKVLDSVRQALTLLQSKAPELVDPFRSVLTAGIDAVANASKGVAPAEQAVIDEISQVLGTAGTSSSDDPRPVESVTQTNAVGPADASPDGTADGSSDGSSDEKFAPPAQN